MRLRRVPAEPLPMNVCTKEAFVGENENVTTKCERQASDLPELLGITQVSSGWINKYELQYRLPNGREITYEVVSRKEFDEYRAEVEGVHEPARVDAVCVVGHTANDEFLLIREFRFPMNRMCVAFPAGLKEPGEGVVEGAARELCEETGYDLVRDANGNPVFAHACVQPGYSSLGMGDESIAMVFAEVERVCDPVTESTEFIETFLLPRADIEGFLAENTEPLSIRCQLVLEMLTRKPFFEAAEGAAGAAPEEA